MKKNNLLLIITCITACAVFLTGCNARLGVKFRDDADSESKIKKWTYNWTTEFKDWETDLGNFFSSSHDGDSSKLYEEDLSKTISNNGIKDIDISIHASNVIIMKSDTDEFKVVCHGKSNIVTDTTVEATGNTLTVKENKASGGSFKFKFGNNSVSRTVSIAIPRSFNGDISFECGAGNTELKDFSCDRLEIDGGAGDLTVNDIFFKDFTLSQGVGTTKINLVRSCGNMDFNGGVGELSVTLKAIGGNLTYSGGVGNAIINIPDNSPIKIDTDSGVGKCTINAHTSGENKYYFDLETGVGNLTVN